MNKTSSFLLLLSFVNLVSCNSSTSEKQCEIVDSAIECDGGYSYWINDLTAVSNGVVAITGVRDYKRTSKQWVAFFSDDLSEKLAEIPFAKNFYADEHNAPAVLAHDDNTWLVVRTGHNDTFEDGLGRLYVYSVSEQFDIFNEVRLSTPTGTTYAQLAKANNKTYLLTRDTQKGWGVFVSDDQGLTWGDWTPLWIEKGRRYISMESFGLDQIGNEQLIFNIGHHPEDNKQNIGYVIVKDNSQVTGIRLSTVSNLLLDDINVATEVHVSINTENDFASGIRFLDSSNQQGNICHLYSKWDNTHNYWQLYLTGHDVKLNKKFDFYIGEFTGVLGESTYINGASVGNCLLNEGEQVDVFVAHQDIDSKEYIIDRIYIDAQSGNTFSNDEVYRSSNQLYRPVYISELNYLMFNEAYYWEHYDSWKAIQRVVKLP